MQPPHPEKGGRVLLCLCRAPLLSVWLAFHKLRKAKETVGRVDATRGPCGLWNPETGELNRWKARGITSSVAEGRPSFPSEMFCISEGCTPGDFGFFSSSGHWKHTLKCPSHSPSHPSSLNLWLSDVAILCFKCPPSPPARGHACPL